MAWNKSERTQFEREVKIVSLWRITYITVSYHMTSTKCYFPVLAVDICYCRSEDKMVLQVACHINLCVTMEDLAHITNTNINTWHTLYITSCHTHKSTWLPLSIHLYPLLSPIALQHSLLSARCFHFYFI